MKNLSLPLLALAALCAQAEHLTPNEALERLKIDAPMKAPARAEAMRVVSTLPELYVFSSGAGYLVTPASDVAPALLGYSDSGTFDPMANPALQWWLDQYSAQIAYAEEHGTLVSANERMRVSRPAIAPLIESRWNQEAPYNDDCPELNGHRCVTGCVATAMAQVMRYHSWPAKGEGSHTYYWSAGQDSLSCNFADITFDWTQMPYRYDSSSSATQKAAVAQLMYACGVSVNMSYDPGDSGAVSRHMGPALMNYFGYDKGMWMPERQYYTLDEWETMVYDELAAERPVLYAGQGSAGGHQFIADGYSSDGYFHFNWGWGGLSDGYFLLTALDPPALGTGGGAGGFNYDQSILLGVQPPVSGSETQYVFYANSFAPTVTSATLGDDVTFGSGFFNYSYATADAYLGIAIEPVSPTTGYTRHWESTHANFAALSGYNQMTVKTLDNLPEGTYKITPVYRIGTDGEWQEMRVALNANPSVTATVSGSTMTFSEPDAPSISVSNFALDSDLYWGSNFKLTFTLTNGGADEYYGGVIPALISADGTELVASAPTDPVDLLPAESTDETYTGKFTAQSTPAAGSYYLGLLDSSGHLLTEPIAVTLNAAAGTTTVEVTNFAIDGSDPVTDPSETKFTVTAECTEGYFADKLTVAVFDLAGGTSKAIGSTDTYYLGAGQSATSTATLDLASLEAGSYQAIVYKGSSNISSPIIFKIGQTDVKIVEEVLPTTPSAILYDLLGRKVANPKHGLYISPQGIICR